MSSASGTERARAALIGVFRHSPNAERFADKSLAALTAADLYLIPADLLDRAIGLIATSGVKRKEQVMRELREIRDSPSHGAPGPAPTAPPAPPEDPRSSDSRSGQNTAPRTPPAAPPSGDS